MQITRAKLSEKPPGQSKRWRNTDSIIYLSQHHYHQRCFVAKALIFLWFIGNVIDSARTFSVFSSHLLDDDDTCAHILLHSGLPVPAVIQVTPWSSSHVNHRATMKDKSHPHSHMCRDNLGLELQEFPMCLTCVFLWTVGGNSRTWREPTKRQREHANSLQKGCRLVERTHTLLKVIVQTTAQLCVFF